MDMERIFVKGVSCTKHTSKHYLMMSNVFCYVLLFAERMHSPMLFSNEV